MRNSIHTKNCDAATILVAKLMDCGISFTYEFDGTYDVVRVEGITKQCLDINFADAVDEAAFDSYESTHTGAA